MNNKEQHLEDTLNYINNGLDIHDYDMADKYAHKLLTSFCGLKSNQKKYQLGQSIKKLVQSLKHNGGLLVQSATNVKTIQKIKKDIIQLY